MNRLASQRIFQLPSKNEIFTAASCKIGIAGSYSCEKRRVAKALNLQSGRALAELGIAEGLFAQHRGMPPLRGGSAPGCRLGVPSARGGGGRTRTPARPPPCALPAARRAPGSGLRSLRSQLPRPPTKIRRKGMGGEVWVCVRRDSCRPLPKSNPCFQGCWVEKRDRTPEDVPREAVWVLGEFGGLRLVERRFTLGRRLFAPNPQL